MLPLVVLAQLRRCLECIFLANKSLMQFQQTVKYLYQRCVDRKWLQEFGDDNGNAPEQSALGVAIRRPDGVYATEPATVDADFLQASRIVGAKVGLTMSSEITESLFGQGSPSR